MSEEAYYLRDGKAWFRHNEIRGADLPTFQVINHTWAKDRRRVYTVGRVERKADPETFDVLNHLYAKDKNHAFYLGGVIKEADASSFVVLDNGIRSKGYHTGFARDRERVFHYVLTIGKPNLLRGVDVESFEVLGHGYARDKNYAYYEWTRVKGADANSFGVLNSYFARDRRKVFYLNRVHPCADVESFGVFCPSRGKDADVESPYPNGLGEYWAKDACKVYRQEKEIPGADPKTAVLVGNMLKDANRVYNIHGAPVDVADVASFEAIGRKSSYFRDRSHVYFDVLFKGWRIVKEADVETFEELPLNHPSGGHAWDKNWIYGNEAKRLKPRNPQP